MIVNIEKPLSRNYNYDINWKIPTLLLVRIEWYFVCNNSQRESTKCTEDFLIAFLFIFKLIFKHEKSCFFRKIFTQKKEKIISKFPPYNWVYMVWSLYNINFIHFEPAIRSTFFFVWSAKKTRKNGGGAPQNWGRPIIFSWKIEHHHTIFWPKFHQDPQAWTIFSIFCE